MSYNGHKNWNHWNVCLWLMNDPGLYGITMYHLTSNTNKDIAAHHILQDLYDLDQTETPDGAPYTFSSVRAALRSL